MFLNVLTQVRIARTVVARRFRRSILRNCSFILDRHSGPFIVCARGLANPIRRFGRHLVWHFVAIAPRMRFVNFLRTSRRRLRITGFLAQRTCVLGPSVNHVGIWVIMTRIMRRQSSRHTRPIPAPRISVLSQDRSLFGLSFQPQSFCFFITITFFPGTWVCKHDLL